MRECNRLYCYYHDHYYELYGLQPSIVAVNPTRTPGDVCPRVLGGLPMKWMQYKINANTFSWCGRSFVRPSVRPFIRLSCFYDVYSMAEFLTKEQQHSTLEQSWWQLGVIKNTIICRFFISDPPKGIHRNTGGVDLIPSVCQIYYCSYKHSNKDTVKHTIILKLTQNMTM